MDRRRMSTWAHGLGQDAASGPAIPDSLEIVAGDLAVGDVFDFAGATLRVEVLQCQGDLIVVEGQGPFNKVALQYLKSEPVTVLLPRVGAI